MAGRWMNPFTRFMTRRRFGRELSQFFDRIHCINLDSRPDRWSYVSGHLARFGLGGQVERFSATDVRDDPELRAREKLLLDNFSLLGMCGCMLSHRAIVESAREARLENVLVFEDDIKVIPANIDSVDGTLQELAELDWDVFYLGATYLFPLKAMSRHLVNVVNGAYATHAIAYNRSVFDQILDLLPADPIEYLKAADSSVNAIDKWLQSDRFNHERFYGANPIMVVQGLQESDIAMKQQDGIEQRQIELFQQNLSSQPRP